eukprot:5900578-Pleurochrysis_carterae.AAC.1
MSLAQHLTRRLLRCLAIFSSRLTLCSRHSGRSQPTLRCVPFSHHAPTRAAVVTPLSFSWQRPSTLAASHSVEPFCFAAAIMGIAAVTPAAAMQH